MEAAVIKLVQEVIASPQLVPEPQYATFNLFSACRIGTEETRHSAILAALLDPNGSHGLGFLPLKDFLEQCGIESIDDTWLKHALVETEKWIWVDRQQRRLDILISDCQNFYIVIENKTVSQDHNEQLSAYASWLNRKRQGRKILLYLTPRGEVPQEENIEISEFKCISYDRDICGWLDGCQKRIATERQPLSLFISQYQNFIRNIWLQEDKMRENEEWLALLDQKEHFFAAKAISEHFGAVRVKMFTDLLNDWGRRQLQEDPDCIGYNPITSDNSNTGFSFDYGHEELRIGFQFPYSGFRGFQYGLAWRDGRSYPVKHEQKDDWKQSEWWPYYKEANIASWFCVDELLFDDDKKAVFLKFLAEKLDEMKQLLCWTKHAAVR